MFISLDYLLVFDNLLFYMDPKLMMGLLYARTHQVGYTTLSLPLEMIRDCAYLHTWQGHDHNYKWTFSFLNKILFFFKLQGLS